MKRENKAFTLAEVLIALTIIGIMAAMTIPALIANKDKAAWTAQLQKTYSTLENARRLTAIDEGGDISGLFPPNDGTQGNVALQAFAQHMNISENCGPSAGCWYDGMKNLNNKNLNNSLWNSDGKYDSAYIGLYGKAILSDGTLIRISSNNALCSTNSGTTLAYSHLCGYIYVDVNGKNPPTYWVGTFLNSI